MELGIVTDQCDGWQIVSVSGEVDIATAPELRERLHALLGQGSTQLIVDLSGVGFLDSTGLGVLVGALKRVRTQGGDLRLVSTEPRITKIFEITRLDSAFGVYGSRDEAVRGEE